MSRLSVASTSGTRSRTSSSWKAGTVLREHCAVAIEDQAALRGQGFDAHAIALRELGVIVVARHLQHHEPADQHQRQRDDDDGGGHARGARTAAVRPSDP